MQIVKRNGDIVSYDFSRIFNAIKAVRDSVALDVSDDKVREMADAVEDVIRQYEKIRKHSIRREAGTNLMDTYKEIFFADSKDVDSYAKADREGYIHIHDKDFSLITLNCCQINLFYREKPLTLDGLKDELEKKSLRIW